MLGSALTKDFVAVHMTWGAVNELTTLTAYHQTIRKTQHPILVQLLNQVIKDERRHFAFYRAQAKLRLERSARARRLTKWVMEHLWTPVGVGVKTLDELDVLVGHLFLDEDGRKACAEMDDTISALPGLGSLRLLSRSADESQKRLNAK
jgi:hypothetical protein